MRMANIQLILTYSISMQQPFFFLHIPKTAGTTLNTILDENFNPESILNVYTDTEKEVLRETTYEQLAQFKLIRGHVFIANFDDILDSPVPMRVFTFLRDPVARVISEYHFLKAWPKSHLYRFLNENNVSLSEYVSSTHPRLAVRGRNIMVNSLSGVGIESMDERLEMAWHNLKDRFTCFGILEQFDASIMLMKPYLDLNNIFYERQNVRTKLVHRPVSTEEIDLIQEHNQADIALYERACTEFQRRCRVMGDSFFTELRIFTKINERFQRVSNLINERDNLNCGAFVNGK